MNYIINNAFVTLCRFQRLDYCVGSRRVGRCEVGIMRLRWALYTIQYNTKFVKRHVAVASQVLYTECRLSQTRSSYCGPLTPTSANLYPKTRHATYGHHNQTTVLFKMYTVSHKKQDTKLLTTTSPTIIRFSKFFSLSYSVVSFQQTRI